MKFKHVFLGIVGIVYTEIMLQLGFPKDFIFYIVTLLFFAMG